MKNSSPLKLDRTVFFCDAVVAIAITLLALDIRIDLPAGQHLQFKHVLAQWKTFAAFFLSFFNIANYWRTHHNFYSNIKDMNSNLLWFNIAWLLFIVLLPFSTTLVSRYFFDGVAILIYSVNIFCISVFQNAIWDYASARPHLIDDEKLNKRIHFQWRLYCNLDMINSFLAVCIAYWSPLIAFALLVTKLPVVLTVMLFYRKKIVQLKIEERTDEDYLP